MYHYDWPNVLACNSYWLIWYFAMLIGSFWLTWL
ncbi:hypothetical protein F383_31907 [Gossypium arboreum]|uniref:Uncharacterized protein n=1 Tax=Gossypium arboreum TaxID=29729 RepID=A0A0B0PJX2_GOSAR|nr:hypothetical protein F383_31907 [Gossypium arboreum]